jgi:hypothetical protein
MVLKNFEEVKSIEKKFSVYELDVDNVVCMNMAAIKTHKTFCSLYLQESRSGKNAKK